MAIAGEFEVEFEHFQPTLFWSKCDSYWKAKHFKSREDYSRGARETQIKYLTFSFQKQSRHFNTIVLH